MVGDSYAERRRSSLVGGTFRASHPVGFSRYWPARNILIAAFSSRSDAPRTSGNPTHEPRAAIHLIDDHTTSTTWETGRTDPVQATFFHTSALCHQVLGRSRRTPHPRDAWQDCHS